MSYKKGASIVVIHSDQKKSYNYREYWFVKSIYNKIASPSFSEKTMLWDPNSAQTRFERLAKNILDRRENPSISSLFKIFTVFVPSLANKKQTE